MSDPVFSEHAERIVLIVLQRWQHEHEPDPHPNASDISSVLFDDISHCLLDFTIDNVDSLPPIHLGVNADEAENLQKIKQAFSVHVTLEVCDRPTSRTALADVQANPQNVTTLKRVYSVKEFESGAWLVMAPV